MKKFFLGLALLLGCTKPSTPSTKPLVIVSVSPYDTFIHRIAGDTVNVQALVPVGYDPHTYEPTPRQFDTLDKAALFIGIGEAYEQKALKTISEHNRQMAVLNLYQSINEDHHYWMSPKKVIEQLTPITKALIKVSPENEKLYLYNLKTLTADLEALQHRLATMLAPYKNQAIIVSHPSLSYFCADFHLKELAIEHHGKSPLPRQVAALLEQAHKEQVRCVFTQQGFDNRGAKLVASRLHLPIYDLSPNDPNYFQNLEKIAKEIIGK